ncbi:hypothetical protein EsHS_00001879 [Epichloe bromicola]
MSDQVDLMSDVQDEIEDILREIEVARHDQGPDWWQTFPELDTTSQSVVAPRPPPSEEYNVLSEIPKNDSTYRHLGSTLIPHTKFPDMYLLEYQTFSGAMAYQPCSRNIDFGGFFEALEPVEKGGDHLFKIARVWSCIIQSIQGLPKEIRWVLATVYNFANDMMRPGTSEAFFWTMRPWLLYWFDVAQALFEKYDLRINAPTMDWFLRPTAVTMEDVEGVEFESYVTLGRTNSVSSDGNGTVIHHRPTGSAYGARIYDREAAHVSSITAWMAAQPEWATVFRRPFDPTPGGRMPSQLESMSRNWATTLPMELGEQDSGEFVLNPEATEFDPNMELAISLGTTTPRSPSRISMNSIEECESASEMDGLSFSERGLTSGEHLRFMIEAHGEDVEMS